MTANAAQLVHAGFLRSCEAFSNQPALEIESQAWTYRELHASAAALGATLQRKTPTGGSRLTAVFSYRSFTTFSGILGSLFAGHGYVPLNPTFPTARTLWMLQTADCRSIVVDSRSEKQIDSILAQVDFPMLVILPEQDNVDSLAKRWPRHTILGRQDMEPPDAWTFRAVEPDAVAYVLFTSGSTGTPKGVMVTHQNVTHFVRAMADRYSITSGDRFSQMFDTTFDLSVFDMFLPWQAGARVCCPSGSSLLNPDKFIREHELTVWASVPSVGELMRRFGVLKEGRYPTIRVSMFCGEPLPTRLATKWLPATPNAVLDNLYGPTELTVACSAYRWNETLSLSESALGIVPIGHPVPGMVALVVDENLREVSPGQAGELLMSGPQVAPGYWRDPEATQRAFVRLSGSDAVFYRTGDRVLRPMDDKPLTYLGRTDHQVKIRGHRVELGEVEAALRQETGVDEAVALGWPITETGAAGVVAFLTGRNVDPAIIRSGLKAKLPGYAVPHAIHVLRELPQNLNGKVDRQALHRSLEAADDVKLRVLSYLHGPISSAGFSPADVPDDFDLIGAGIIDSLGFVTLIAEIERQLGFEIELDELDLDHLTTLGTLCRYIEERRVAEVTRGAQ